MESDEHINALLAGFLAGEVGAHSELPALIGSEIVARAVALCDARMKRLDLAEDVAQRTWELLLVRHVGAFQPDKGSAWNYIHGVMLNAVRDVRAEHIPAGFRTRDESAASISLDQVAEVAEVGSSVDDPELILVESRSSIDYVVRLSQDSEPWVIEAMTAIAWSGDNVAQAARRLGRSRMSLRRALDKQAPTIADAWLA